MINRTETIKAVANFLLEHPGPEQKEDVAYHMLVEDPRFDLTITEIEEVYEQLVSNDSPCWICGLYDNPHLVTFVEDDPSYYAHSRCTYFATGKLLD